MKRLWILFVLVTACVSANGAAPAGPPVILVFGDSISAGYGLPRIEQGWVTLLQAKLMKEGYGYEVVNASVSGETTEGGLGRLPRALSLHHPSIVILELGGNDGLRALPIAPMRANLARMAELSTAAGAKIVLVGMRIPPNYGPQYTEQFSRVYAQIAHDDHLALVPFLLDGVALTPTLMQDDGIHPNGAGQPRLLENVWPALAPLLKPSAHAAP